MDIEGGVDLRVVDIRVGRLTIHLLLLFFITLDLEMSDTKVYEP